VLRYNYALTDFQCILNASLRYFVNISIQKLTYLFHNNVVTH